MPNYHVAAVQFEPIEEIGQEGKNSRVFKIRDSALNAEMVLKQVPKIKFQTPEQFFDEARMLYAIQHPNVVEVNYACFDNDFVYMTMPFYSNGSLSRFMNGRFLTVREIIRYSIQFLSGLHHIHSNGLLHFDLKPDNIMLSVRNEAMLSDFGLAKYMDAYGFNTPRQIYSSHTPPELINTKLLTTTSDIYQAGLTIYRMCVGSDNFNSQYAKFGTGADFDRAHFEQELVNGIFPDRNVLPEHIPNKLHSVINRCLAVDPVDRYQAVIEVVNALSDVDDRYFDWQYENLGHIRKWSKTSDTGVLHCIELDENQKSEAYKVNGQGRRTRTSKYTKPKITTRELNRFFKGE
ncbi:serine/threonine protein kinase [Vibrio sp. JC009]|uniref:serine/threonine-protein kinase n=1 Tax=Vibrio sp. JC009 TaxID=2912314 RepID=UPI0023B058CD|nr:serine/threonine-protein kinase [Vibrio sp. JC009]WED21559.1 serine/threonine protein kinase [Vibrio sp. JC009]